MAILRNHNGYYDYLKKVVPFRKNWDTLPCANNPQKKISGETLELLFELTQALGPKPNLCTSVSISTDELVVAMERTKEQIQRSLNELRNIIVYVRSKDKQLYTFSCTEEGVRRLQQPQQFWVVK